MMNTFSNEIRAFNGTKPARKNNKSSNTTATFVNALKQEQNWKNTENGALAKKSTCDKLYDMFALGGAYRKHSEQDCILLFKEAYAQNPEYALKCLWYLRDIMEGQGERRFFRVCLKWLASYDKKAVLRNLETIARDGFGRFDDLFVLFDTPCEQAVMDLITKQFVADMKAYRKGAAVSLLAKWAPSSNASSAKTKHNARRIIHALGVSERDYRKMLSALRERIHVVERLMSQNRWNEIDFSHLPSRAGLIYRNAFKSKGLIAEKYREFAKDTKAKVNAGTLYPYDVVCKARDLLGAGDWWGRGKSVALNDTERLVINKYWSNLTDYFRGAQSNMMVVCDTSGSMTMGSGKIAPIDVAVSLAMYAAERAEGPFKNHYISFSRQAKLIEVRGVDFCDKVKRIVDANLCENTNLESVFDLVINTAMTHRLPASAVPKTLVIVSDMEVDRCSGVTNRETFMDSMRHKWQNRCDGRYEFPNIVCWNVNARSNTFLADPKSGMTFVSGASPVLFEQVLKGVTGEQLMFNKLNSERYKEIH